MTANQTTPRDPVPPARWWWLSFVDRADDPETGSAALQLGVSVVLAPTFGDAVQEAWDYNCNPGGEVAGQSLGFGLEATRRIPAWRNLAYRLLQEPDITEAQVIIDRERERVP